MTNARNSLVTTLAGTLTLGAIICLSGCGGGGGESDEAQGGASSATGASSGATSRAPDSGPAPDFDPDARYNGKTLDEYASGLEDLNPSVREQALEDIANFGANAYPLRDRMRTMAAQDTEDELRADAVGALFRMEDPGAEAFVLERLGDPEAMQTDRGWRLLLRVASEEIEPDRLASEGRAIAESDTAHAERLLGVGGPAPFRAGLATTLMQQEHSDGAVAPIFQMLPELDITPGERIGDTGAFAVAMRILDESDPGLRQRLGYIVSFPGDDVSGAQKIDAIGAWMEGAGEPEAQQLFGAMEQVAQSAGDGAAWSRFEGILGASATDASADPRIRALAMIYLCEGVGAGAMSAGALDPVFDAIETSPEEIILGTALGELQKAVARAPEPVVEGLPVRLVEAMYVRPADDGWSHAVADGLLDCLSSGISRLDMDSAIDALHAELDAHPGHPVNFQVLQWTVQQGASLRRAGADMPQAGRLAGRLLVDGSIGPAEAGWLYNSANLSSYNNTSVAEIDTIMAHYTPILMTAELPEGQYYRQMHETAIGTLYHLKREPEKAQRVLEWAERMANQAPAPVKVDILWGINTSWYNAHQPAHRSGCAHVDIDIAGTPAKLKPMSFGDGHNRKQALAPGHFITGEPGEAFLMTVDTSTDPRSLGRLGPIETPMTVAFLDAQGTVIAMGRTDDESLHTGVRRHLSLTHPDAQHALVYADGAFDLSEGVETGIDPEFLAEL